MNDQLTAINPFELLNAVFEIDEVAAVRIANKWGGPEATREQNDAAWETVQRQTTFSVCLFCQWPVIDESHTYCEEQLREPVEEPNFGDCTRCGTDLEESEFAIGDVCDGCRPQHMEDWEANQERLAEEAADRHRYPEESDDDINDDYDDDDGCPHCGSHTCDTWACQQ